MILLLLSILDVLGAICLATNSTGFIGSTIGLFILVKGIFSLLGSLASRRFFDWMGYMDIMAGACLIIPFIIPWFWVLFLLKGIYSLLFSFFS